MRSQQHGSVYWSDDGEHALRNLHKGKSLEEQLQHAFAYPYSPNWQDASTQSQCDSFDRHLGDEVQLAIHTGSKAHHVRRALQPRSLEKMLHVPFARAMFGTARDERAELLFMRLVQSFSSGLIEELHRSVSPALKSCGSD